MKHHISLLGITLMIACAAGYTALAQQAANNRNVISYQGMLASSDGTPVLDGEYEIAVALYGDEHGATRVWRDTYQVRVSGGVFSIYLGSGNVPLPAPSQMDRALWIGTQISGGNEMRPLTRLSATPYALNVPDQAITTSKLSDGAVTKDKMNLNYVEGVSINGEKIQGKGTVLKIQAGKDIDVRYDENTQSVVIGTASTTRGEVDTKENDRGLQGTALDAWTMRGEGISVLSGAAVPATASDYIGTNAPGNVNFNIRVNSQPVMTYQPNGTTTPSIIGGSGSNGAPGNGQGNIIAGGGSGAAANTIQGLLYNSIVGGEGNKIQNAGSNYGVIGGGVNNSIGSAVVPALEGVIAGGNGNQVLALRGVIGGGQANIIYQNGVISTIAGGRLNTINANFGTIGGGVSNALNGSMSTIAGGEENVTYGDWDVIAGGFMNQVSGPASGVLSGESNAVGMDHSVIAGGIANRSSGSSNFLGGGSSNYIDRVNNAVIGGGSGNRVAGNSSGILAGSANNIEADHSAIAAGLGNQALGEFGFIGSGDDNIIEREYSLIGGGRGNRISGSFNFIGNGLGNVVTTDFSAIANGNNNQIYGAYGFVGNGESNIVNAEYSAIGSGRNNQINGPQSFIGGGENNEANADYVVIGGGAGNIAQNSSTVIGGGQSNSASGDASTISGGVSNITDPRSIYSAIGGGVGNRAFNNAPAATIPGGDNLLVQSYGQTAVGVWNIPRGNFPFRYNGQPRNNDPLFMVGNGIAPARSNAFEVSYNGHSTVYHTNGQGTPVITGSTYTDNTMYAWGDIGWNGTALVRNGDFGITSITRLGAGWYRVRMTLTTPTGTATNLSVASITANVSTNAPAGGMFSKCKFVTVSRLNGTNEFDILITEQRFNAGTMMLDCVNVDESFMFKVAGRP